jgi:hypothetical protein
VLKDNGRVMQRKYAVKLTEKDNEFLEIVKKYGLITVESGGINTVGIEGDAKVQVWRIKRLLALGYLTPNNDGLLDGC